MNKNFYFELPEEYKEFYKIDAKNNKTTIILFNVFALIIAAIVGVLGITLKNINIDRNDSKSLNLMLFGFIFLAIIYVILHELTHGLLYKILTKQKLTFGLTLSVAFCGVPHIYVNKKTALLSVLAPFVVYNIIFIPLLIFLPGNFIYLTLFLVYLTHASGCVGDLYVAYILLKTKGELLMNDTGPIQTFYKKSE
jgi:hypothetical protein